jgi:hypothetical protein
VLEQPLRVLERQRLELRARPGTRALGAGERLHRIDQPLHPPVVLEQGGDRPAVARQLRLALQRDEQRVFLAAVVEAARVEPEEAHEGRGVLRPRLAPREAPRVHAQAARHLLDEVVLPPQIVDQPHRQRG